MTDNDNRQQSQLFGPRQRKPQQRWINAQQERDALKAAWLARPAEEVATDMARLEDLLFSRARWKFASTMRDNPHSYTLRRTWLWPGGNDDFRWCAQTIRTIGDREKFPPEPGGRWYTVLHLRGCRFWTMNWPIDYSNGKPWTILINRKPPTGDQR